MRFNHKHEIKNYLANRRIAVIQKAHHRTYTLIQFVNNELIDKKILEWSDKYKDIFYNPYNYENVYNRIIGVNQVASTRDLQRRLQHSLVTRDIIMEVEARRVINDVSDSLTKLEVERVVKNLDYVENVLETTNVAIDKYEALIEKLPRQVSRKEVLERCITSGDELPASKRQAWLERNLERGASYNKEYSYRELNQLSRDLERYKTNRLDYETARLENIQADREGYDRVNVTKTWIWSRLDKTRHSGMDGETVDFAEKFEVVNEVTGDVDYLRFPHDVEFEHNGCSNTCNCCCSYEINKG